MDFLPLILAYVSFAASGVFMALAVWRCMRRGKMIKEWHIWLFFFFALACVITASLLQHGDKLV